MSTSSTKTTISRAQYYQLIGLQAAHIAQMRILKALEDAAVEITGEVDHNGTPERCGHTLDWIGGDREFNDMLKLLELEVVDP